MRTDWILFAILSLLWLGAGGIRLRSPRRTELDDEQQVLNDTQQSI